MSLISRLCLFVALLYLLQVSSAFPSSSPMTKRVQSSLMMGARLQPEPRFLEDGAPCVVGSTGPAAANQNQGCARGPIAQYRTGQKGLNLIKQFEGFRGNFYLDPVGIRTIGYGHACHAHPCTGGIFDKGHITEREGEDLLKQDLVSFENCVKQKITVPLTQNEFDALVSFTFNLGCGSLQESNLRRVLNANNYAAVPEELNKWVKAGGRTLEGLVRRRRAEGDLFKDNNCGGAAGGATGVCKADGACQGQVVTGYCEGGLKCCVQGQATTSSSSSSAEGKCTAQGVEGVCISTSECRAPKTSVPGFCPGADNIQCCITPNPNAPNNNNAANGNGNGNVNIQGGRVTINYPNIPKLRNLVCENLGAVTNMEAFEAGRSLGQIATVKVQNKPVEIKTACVFLKMREASGLSMVINSGFRTMDEQRYFYNCYVTRSCNNGNLAARPGYSNHQNGIALDLGTGGGVFEWLTSHGREWGFKRTVPSENWHWEFRPNETQ